LNELFGRTAPLQVDLGYDNESFLAAAAAGNPEQDFLAMEASGREDAKRLRQNCHGRFDERPGFYTVIFPARFNHSFRRVPLISFI
jgi:hypothetical protein